MRQVRNRGLVTSALAVLTTAALLLMGAVPAHALVTPVSGTSLVGSKVTINDDHFHPGDTITVSGTGFEVDPMTSGNPGSPVLAIKLNGSQYEAGGFPWEAGGASYIDPEDLPTAGGSEGYAPFVIAGDGTFSGSITIPEDWDEFGPHFLTLLGGSLSTQNPGKTLRVQTFEVHFTVLAEDQAWAEITSIAHAQDSPNNSNIGVKLRNFVRQDGLGGQKVAFRINASGDVLACVETDAAGDANAIVPLPTKATRLLAAGENTLNVLAGNACGEGAQPPGRSIPVTFKLASSTLTSTVHFPGSEIGVALRGFLENGVFGGQKVALVITQPGGDYRSQIACVDTDDAGNVDAAANLPADIPLGSYRLNALAGTACGAGSQPRLARSPSTSRSSRHPSRRSPTPRSPARPRWASSSPRPHPPGTAPPMPSPPTSGSAVRPPSPVPLRTPTPRWPPMPARSCASS